MGDLALFHGISLAEEGTRLTGFVSGKAGNGGRVGLAEKVEFHGLGFQSGVGWAFDTYQYRDLDLRFVEFFSGVIFRGCSEDRNS